MPYAVKRRYRRRRRSYRGRRYGNRRRVYRRAGRKFLRGKRTYRPWKNTRTRIPYTLAPEWLFTKLRYTYQVNVVGPAPGSPNVYYISGNNVYNPDPQRITETVAGFDYYSRQYERYYVSSSSIKIMTVSNNDAIMIHAIRPHREQVTWGVGSTFDDQLEQPGVVRKMIGSRYGGKSYTIMRSYATTQRLFEIKNSQAQAEDEYMGQGTDSPSGPTANWWWNIVWTPVFPSATPEFAIHLQVTYYCKWKRRAVDFT